MNAKKNAIRFTVALACVLLISGCAKYRDSNCGWDKTTDVYHHVSDDSKSKIPYAGHDTLVFRSEAGDTATLYGEGKQTYYVTTTSQSNTADCGGLPEYKYYYENVKVNFSGTSPFVQSFGFIVYKNDKDTHPLTNSIRILMNDMPLTITNFEFLNSVTQPEDSIIFQNVYHSGIFTDDIKRNVLFNYNKGILRFKDFTNITWTKIK